MLGPPSKHVFLLLTFISSKVDPRGWRVADSEDFWEPCLFFHTLFWHCQMLVLAGWQRLSAAARWLNGCPVIHCPEMEELWMEPSSPRKSKSMKLTSTIAPDVSERHTAFWLIHAWWPWPRQRGKALQFALSKCQTCAWRPWGIFPSQLIMWSCCIGFVFPAITSPPFISWRLEANFQNGLGQISSGSESCREKSLPNVFQGKIELSFN